MEKNNISLETIKGLLEKIKHPSIDETLFNLGIIKDVKFKDNKANIILAFPFENIIIRDQLIEMVKKPLEKLDIEVDVETTVMNQEELQKFLREEQEYWKG